MAERVVYASRLVRLPLLGADGAEVGGLADVVLGASAGASPPQVIGFVVALQRRRVFVGVGRVGELSPEGGRLRRGSLNVRQFELRPGETLAVGQLLGRQVRGRRVVDVGLRATPAGGWEVATVALAGGRLIGRRRARDVVDWPEAGDLFADRRGV